MHEAALIIHGHTVRFPYLLDGLIMRKIIKYILSQQALGFLWIADISDGHGPGHSHFYIVAFMANLSEDFKYLINIVIGQKEIKHTYNSKTQLILRLTFRIAF